MLEQELIKAAVDKLNQQTGLEFGVRTNEKNAIDAELVLPGINHRLMIECKKWLNTAYLQKYLAELTLKNNIADVLLVTDYINPNQAALLKKHAVPFLDLAGNTHINQPPVYIDIQGKKPEKLQSEVALAKQLGKAFQPKGMKVVFVLLTQPELVNAPMRTIAKVAEVALGTVKQVLDDLLYQGFIVQKGLRKKEFVNRQGLLDKWLDAYPIFVEAKLEKEIYTTNNLELLRNLEIDNLKALWGGEFAVEQYDNYLNAKDYLIYVGQAHKNEILKAARLRKAKPAEVEDHTTTKVVLVEPFLGTEKIEGKRLGLAHPYLIYANLLASLDPRNIDAARRFNENHIA